MEVQEKNKWKKTFTNAHRFAKFVKIFFHVWFPIYDTFTYYYICMTILISESVYITGIIKKCITDIRNLKWSQWLKGFLS